ncbi:hypothetical protein [Aurantimonas coralicida]|nr:hypothetical protein [Aurantimonas coralicida]
MNRGDEVFYRRYAAACYMSGLQLGSISADQGMVLAPIELEGFAGAEC